LGTGRNPNEHKNHRKSRTSGPKLRISHRSIQRTRNLPNYVCLVASPWRLLDEIKKKKKTNSRKSNQTSTISFMSDQRNLDTLSSNKICCTRHPRFVTVNDRQVRLLILTGVSKPFPVALDNGVQVGSRFIYAYRNAKL
jgi:hypothetical protein